MGSRQNNDNDSTIMTMTTGRIMEEDNENRNSNGNDSRWGRDNRNDPAPPPYDNHDSEGTMRTWTTGRGSRQQENGHEQHLPHATTSSCLRYGYKHQ